MVGAFFYGKKHLEQEIAEGAVKRARKAKDTDGSKLASKWLRPRD